MSTFMSPSSTSSAPGSGGPKTSVGSPCTRLSSRVGGGARLAEEEEEGAGTQQWRRSVVAGRSSGKK